MPAEIEDRERGAGELVEQAPGTPIPDPRVLAAAHDQARTVEGRSGLPGRAREQVVGVESGQEVVVGNPVAGHVVSPDLLEHPSLVHGQRSGDPLLVRGELAEHGRIRRDRDRLRQIT